MDLLSIKMYKHAIILIEYLVNIYIIFQILAKPFKSII